MSSTPKMLRVPQSRQRSFPMPGAQAWDFFRKSNSGFSSLRQAFKESNQTKVFEENSGKKSKERKVRKRSAQKRCIPSTVVDKLKDKGKQLGTALFFVPQDFSIQVDQLKTNRKPICAEIIILDSAKAIYTDLSELYCLAQQWHAFKTNA